MARSRRSRASSTPRLLAASISTTSRLVEPVQMRRQPSHSPQGSPGAARRIGPLAVEGHGEEPGGGGLPDAARAGEEVAVADPAVLDRTAQHGRDVVLDQEIAELFGAVATGERDGHGRERRLGMMRKCLRHPEATPDIA